MFLQFAHGASAFEHALLPDTRFTGFVPDADVAAWFASMTAFWLVTRHLLPAEVLPANRVPHPGAYAIAAGMGALQSELAHDLGRCCRIDRQPRPYPMPAGAGTGR